MLEKERQAGENFKSYLHGPIEKLLVPPGHFDPFVFDPSHFKLVDFQVSAARGETAGSASLAVLVSLVLEPNYAPVIE